MRRALLASAIVLLSAQPARCGEVITEEIVLDCASPCSHYADPRSHWERPSCTEYDMDEALIEAAHRGDSSARSLLVTRHETTFTNYESVRIAAGLLGLGDDSQYWDELFSLAEQYIRNTLDHERLLAKAAAHSCRPDEYNALLYDAFDFAAGDPRSKPLLYRALEQKDVMLLYPAIEGFARQKDKSAEDAIRRAIANAGDDASQLQPALDEYEAAIAAANER